ncbi:MAG: hypothetical protein FJX72_07225 [Armatimonadetes bacterium]|nr:hypothetical protein [Armatimonadota bacterium]
MQVRSLLMVVAGMLAVAGIAFLVLGRKPVPGGGARQARTGPGTAANSLAPAIVPDAALIGRYTAAATQPRLIANLAVRVGSNLVSVRQIYAADRVRGLFDNDVRPGSIGVCQLVLQVNAVTGASADSAGLDSAAVEAVDDHGVRMAPVEAPIPLAGSTPTAGGRTFTLFLSAPHPDALLIRSLSGALRPTAGGPPSPFTIRDVPLPGSPRLFGDVTPLALRSGADEATSGALEVLLGDDADAASVGAQAEAATASLPYLRLVLPVGRPTPLVGATRSASPPLVAAHPKPSGHVELTFRLGSQERRVTVWDREPVLITLPAAVSSAPTMAAGETGGQATGVLIHISRTDEIVMLPAARTMFPATARSPAGSLVVRFRVGARPIGPAVVPFTMSRREAGVWGSEHTSEAPIRAGGQAIIGNLRPGSYRVTFHAERMSPGITHGIGLGEYLLKRYGAAFGRWAGGVSQQVTVAPAGRTYGATVVFVPRSAER